MLHDNPRGYTANIYVIRRLYNIIHVTITSAKTSSCYLRTLTPISRLFQSIKKVISTIMTLMTPRRPRGPRGLFVIAVNLFMFKSFPANLQPRYEDFIRRLCLDNSLLAAKKHVGVIFEFFTHKTGNM